MKRFWILLILFCGCSKPDTCIPNGNLGIIVSSESHSGGWGNPAYTTIVTNEGSVNTWYAVNDPIITGDTLFMFVNTQGDNPRRWLWWKHSGNYYSY